MMNIMNINHGIIIYSDTITPMAKKIIEDPINIVLEMFVLDELQFNITKHILVPEHILLTDKQGFDIKKKLGSRLPVLLSSDPVSRFYKFKRGNIIKVIRRNGYIAYRIVR
jgi:DNA-directed RNA polymerase I, II, and III subunit RPABC1